MVFTVEDGTGLEDANAYCEVAFASDYASLRGLEFDGDVADQQAALVKASDYIDARFEFRGSKKTYAQGLSWPRTGASDRSEGVTIPDNVVPKVLKRAVAELAIKVLAGTALIEDLARGGKVVSQSVGEISVTYSQDADPATKYGITDLLKGIVRESQDDPIPYSGSTVDGGTFTSGMFDNESVP